MIKLFEVKRKNSKKFESPTDDSAITHFQIHDKPFSLPRTEYTVNNIKIQNP